MELLLAALQHPFTWGLLAGLTVAGFQFFKILGLKSRIRALEGQMLKGNELSLITMSKLQNEVAGLRTTNQNLRDKLAQFSHSPRGAVAAQLEAYKLAIETLTLNAPGFAQSWTLAFQEAQKRIATEIEGAAKPRPGFLDSLPFLRPKARLTQAVSSENQPSPPVNPAI